MIQELNSYVLTFYTLNHKTNQKYRHFPSQNIFYSLLQHQRFVQTSSILIRYDPKIKVLFMIDH